MLKHRRMETTYLSKKDNNQIIIDEKNQQKQKCNNNNIVKTSELSSKCISSTSSLPFSIYTNTKPIISTIVVPSLTTTTTTTTTTATTSATSITTSVTTTQITTTISKSAITSEAAAITTSSRYRTGNQKCNQKNYHQHQLLYSNNNNYSDNTISLEGGGRVGSSSSSSPYSHVRNGNERNDEFVEEEDDDDDDDEDENDDNMEEIPVWVNGEQRWISGVTNETTSSQLIEALLLDDGVHCKQIKNILHKYVITERWRRVEQTLNNSQKILHIWKEWAEAQSEVRFTLRLIDDKHHTEDYTEESTTLNNVTDMNDSGRESPTETMDTSNSAILRRKRHRTAKSTSSWITNAQTIHPKSSKSTIEKLMKLILEQGETIQQQLVKLKDRENQISRIEEERHRLREKEHGKNYLLETYLNGLHDVIIDDDDDDDDNDGNVDDDDKGQLLSDQRGGNSGDSGVHTEEVTTSPDIACMTSAKQLQQQNEHIVVDGKSHKRKLSSKRELQLLKEHKLHTELKNSIKEISSSEEFVDEPLNTKDESNTSLSSVNGNDMDRISQNIAVFEKIIMINKHLQHEEELMIRLNAKIKRYEANDPSLTEQQIIDAIERINTEINSSQNELQNTEHELEIANDMLAAKTNVINLLNKEIEELELNDIDEVVVSVPAVIDNNTHNDNPINNDNAILNENIIGCNNQNDDNINISNTMPQSQINANPKSAITIPQINQINHHSIYPLRTQYFDDRLSTYHQQSARYFEQNEEQQRRQQQLQLQQQQQHQQQLQQQQQHQQHHQQQYQQYQMHLPQTNYLPHTNHVPQTNCLPHTNHLPNINHLPQYPLQSTTFYADNTNTNNNYNRNQKLLIDQLKLEHRFYGKMLPCPTELLSRNQMLLSGNHQQQQQQQQQLPYQISNPNRIIRGCPVNQNYELKYTDPLSLSSSSSSAAAAAAPSASSYIVPDQLILSNAPRYFEKDDYNNLSQINLLQNTNHQRTLNSIKVGPKKLINSGVYGFYKEPADSDTGVSSMGADDGSQLGTLV